MIFDDDIDQLDDVCGIFKRNGGIELRVSRKQYNWQRPGRYTPVALQRQAYANGVTLAPADGDEVIDALKAARLSLGRDATPTAASDATPP